jgi:hypothetical protein
VLYALANVFDPNPASLEGLIFKKTREHGGELKYLISGHESVNPVSSNKMEVNLPIINWVMEWPSFLNYLRAVSMTNNGLAAHHSLGSKFNFAAFSYSGRRTLDDASIEVIHAISRSPFEKALSFDEAVRPKLLIQWIANNRTQSALAKADGDLDAAQVYDQALARITNLIKDVCDLDVEFKLNRSPLEVTVRVNGDLIHFDGLPDGLKSIISWVADLSLRLEAVPWENPGDVFEQPIFLFLDEVDIHLHPKWQRRILPAIQKLLPNAQVFVSTHSPFVVGSVEDAWVYRLPEPGSGITEVKAMPAGAGKSYRLILEEVFDIDTEFDIETEAKFADLYQARQEFLKNPANDQPLLEAARWLQARSPEAALIVSRELRQVSRLTGKELSLA